MVPNERSIRRNQIRLLITAHDFACVLLPVLALRHYPDTLIVFIARGDHRLSGRFHVHRIAFSDFFHRYLQKHYDRFLSCRNWIGAAACLLCVLPVTAAPPRTWALLVGISEYEKLPSDLWLQYADKDARTFAGFLRSARGGAVPAAQMLVLSNREATTAAVRKAFTTFLKDGPGREDTVYIMVAGHGTVDANGAYILTYDSDPENLARSAITMGELRALVEHELTIAGRVVLLADVCRAAAIAGQKSAGIGGAVEKLSDVPGEMLGLMAARPKELSNEGPQFGGGHGAFTYSVLKGLEGAADADHDGAVTAGELIDYVTTDVAKMTDSKQHPRDFGNMDNSTRLAGTAK